MKKSSLLLIFIFIPSFLLFSQSVEEYMRGIDYYSQKKYGNAAKSFQTLQDQLGRSTPRVTPLLVLSYYNDFFYADEILELISDVESMDNVDTAHMNEINSIKFNVQNWKSSIVDIRNEIIENNDLTEARDRAGRRYRIEDWNIVFEELYALLGLLNADYYNRSYNTGKLIEAKQKLSKYAGDENITIQTRVAQKLDFLDGRIAQVTEEEKLAEEKRLEQERLAEEEKSAKERSRRVAEERRKEQAKKALRRNNLGKQIFLTQGLYLDLTSTDFDFYGSEVTEGGAIICDVAFSLGLNVTRFFNVSGELGLSVFDINTGGEETGTEGVNHLSFMYGVNASVRLPLSGYSLLADSSSKLSRDYISWKKYDLSFC